MRVISQLYAIFRTFCHFEPDCQAHVLKSISVFHDVAEYNQGHMFNNQYFLITFIRFPFFPC
jgi:hypothetical protein